MIFDRSYKRLLYQVVAGTIVFLAIVLVGLLAAASANTEFFDRYFTLLYKVNLVIGVLLVVIIGGLMLALALRARRGKFGTRLMTKLAVFFGVVGVLPGVLIYLVSLQFVSRSIESWFDVKVESALEAGLNLGRTTMDASLAELQNKGRLIAEQIGDGSASATAITLNRLREQFGVQEATIFAGSGRVVATSSSTYDTLVPDFPSQAVLEQARAPGGYASLEGGSDSAADGGEAASAPVARAGNRRSDLYQLRVVLALGTTTRDDAALAPHTPVRRWAGSGLLADRRPDDGSTRGFGLIGEAGREERFLQLVQPVPQALARNADAVQRAYQEYQEKALGRTGLRKMYIGTLTLTLFLAVFIAVMLALLLGAQLARPLLMLLQGTREVAEGDLSPKRELHTRDELGLLTQQFNQMTRQLADARRAVEQNRAALEQSKAYLESVLTNLTAGVFVFDHRFVLLTANPGAERIFKQPFGAWVGQSLPGITPLQAFAGTLEHAFAEHDVSAAAGGGAAHWQKQVEIPLADEDEPLTLLVRGTRLPGPSVGARGTERGYVVVFDDISDVISAQRSVAWGEVARRLAHEIKNPLTPIQLSAERLEMKLSPKLSDADAEVLRRGATTIVNQVAAMKRMVDDFRDYARTPPAVLQELDLNALCAEVLHLYGIDHAGQSDHPVIEVRLGASLPLINGDPTQLRQVIHNLLQNALDAVADNEAAGRPAAHVMLQTDTVEYDDASGARRQAVRLSIADNGTGFSSRILNRAFEPYVTTKAKGTGLGLAMVKKIMDEHGARIELRNRQSGTDITVGAQVSILFVKLA
ncbi:sensor histidine kinase [Ralstonia solanacearum]|uniref:sensor histidine kinase n=1 Tax=Ralstonia solanacearum TaxID=305 RepID=UPI000500B688|nr:PAS domain-containing sensor histidine kinase [Ralstonia solanacearum]KFX80107.1 histidine kinase [Ralstonia solanacearum]OCQ63698.1 PAS domain-containing sensor histidine kinase [Ralstonia solanacearum]